MCIRDRLYVGDTRVLSAGVYGKADVTANVTYINGEETNREVVASVTLSEPVAELQAVSYTHLADAPAEKAYPARKDLIVDRTWHLRVHLCL